jgi:hypothetical protein
LLRSFQTGTSVVPRQLPTCCNAQVEPRANALNRCAALAAPPGCPTHRDFVPWRFSDAGRMRKHVLPASENLHKCGHLWDWGEVTTIGSRPSGGIAHLRRTKRADCSIATRRDLPTHCDFRQSC